MLNRVVNDALKESNERDAQRAYKAERALDKITKIREDHAD